MNEKLQVITEVLDLSSQHVPEGKYLAAMNAVRDIYNQNVEHEYNERFVNIIRTAVLDRMYPEPSWWNKPVNLTHKQLITSAVCGLMGGVVLYKVLVKLVAIK